MLSGLDCCGIREENDIGVKKPKTILRSAYRERMGWRSEPNCAYIIFTSVVKYSRNKHKRKSGYALAKYIKKHKLGIITTVRSKKNPNTGNTIKAWLWNIDDRAFCKWYRGK